MNGAVALSNSWCWVICCPSSLPPAMKLNCTKCDLCRYEYYQRFRGTEGQGPRGRGAKGQGGHSASSLVGSALESSAWRPTVTVRVSTDNGASARASPVGCRTSSISRQPDVNVTQQCSTTSMPITSHKWLRGMAHHTGRELFDKNLPQCQLADMRIQPIAETACAPSVMRDAMRISALACSRRTLAAVQRCAVPLPAVMSRAECMERALRPSYSPQPSPALTVT
jgi:hypothetical protein